MSLSAELLIAGEQSSTRVLVWWKKADYRGRINNVDVQMSISLMLCVFTVAVLRCIS